ncbi:MAG: dTDP-4-dehydrorhamnose 3,5-epimerase [Chthoniobacterales bacterium]
MIFTETPLKGAFVIELEEHRDARGFFARTFCRREFESQGIELEIVQANFSYNRAAGTLRGLHWQEEPASESKLVRCVQGSIYYVMVDLRSESDTYGQHFGVELSADNKRSAFVPKLCANGFQSLRDETIVAYQMGEYYTPASAAGYRYDSPALSISWPLSVTEISQQDLAWPQFTP